jgi:hypothetical protein
MTDPKDPVPPVDAPAEDAPLPPVFDDEGGVPQEPLNEEADE